MGLDQYLEARQYVSRKVYNKEAQDYEANPRYETLVADNFPKGLSKFADFAGGSVSMVVGKWRKANQIHRWFVENIQDGEDDCGEYMVTQEELGELGLIIDQILDVPAGTEERIAVAEELLPVEQGFFFGSYEYGEYYFEQLEYTLQLIKHLAQSEDFDKLSFYYSSSW